MTKRIRKASFEEKYLNSKVALPYGLEVNEVALAIKKTYDFLFDVNDFLVRKSYERLEGFLLGNALSGLISEIIVKTLAEASPAIERNSKIGGHPDLVPAGKYPSEGILKGDEGIEIKSSIQRGGWQGHNPEKVWLMVFRYTKGELCEKIRDTEPITFVQVLCAQLEKKDWSFSGRRGESRRTITASVTANGMDKLRSNPVYQDPKYVVGKNRALRSKYIGDTKWFD